MTQPVEVGFVSFTEVPPGAHRAYNEWHQLDHLPEQYGIGGVVHGERWVATPACAAARLVVDEVLGRAQYLTLYLMTEPIEETLGEFRQLAVELRAVDRFFMDRESHLNGPWQVAGMAAAPGALVRAEVVPWRPARGVYVVVEREPSPPPDAALLDVAGVAGWWTFQREEHDRITVLWLDADPVETAAAIAPVLEKRWASNPDLPVLAGPMATVKPWEWAWFD